jgi:hypothetical protein
MKISNKQYFSFPLMQVQSQSPLLGKPLSASDRRNARFKKKQWNLLKKELIEKLI